ncbi:MAG: 30S ribosomal protein S20 [Verrucomicrobiota bacterium]
MPNTKSAARRVRSGARKQAHNRSIKTRLHSLEKQYLGLLGAGKKADATTLFKQVSSAFDKAVKTGVLHKSTASRKKSRLSLRLQALK